VILQLIDTSIQNKCFIVTNNNDIIPAINCKINGSNMVMYDFLHNKKVSIPHESIIYYFNYTDENNKEYISYKTHHKTLQDIAKVENITLSNKFLYKDIPLNKKIISLYLDINYDDITIEILKEFWKTKISEYCNKFELYIDNEFKFTDNDLYRSELTKIKKSINTLRKFKELNQLKTKEEIIKYWPALLMPCPSFVDYN
jgi:hypothetical protein